MGHYFIINFFKIQINVPNSFGLAVPSTNIATHIETLDNANVNGVLALQFVFNIGWDLLRESHE
jgi:hypothetical protein